MKTAKPAARSKTVRVTAPRERTQAGRVTVLAFVLVALALTYTYPVRLYLAQESEITRLETDLVARRAAIARQTLELQKWNDPLYIEAQARDRLHRVHPGETALIVVGEPAPAAPDGGAVEVEDRWYDTLWGSVRDADG